jgi:hypothetical protein
MAIQRLSLTQIGGAILEIMGYANSTMAPWKTDINLALRINTYGQRLPMRLNTIAAQMGLSTPVRFDMWKTVADSGAATTVGMQVAAGSAVAYMPNDYDHWISVLNLADNSKIHPISQARRWETTDLIDAAPGMTRYIDIGGFVTQGANWRRQATLYPTPPTGYLPLIRLEYWRLPAIMPNVNPNFEYPDIDPKYDYIFVCGPVTDVARSTGQEFDRFAAQEKELLVEMLSTCRSV